MSLFERKQPIGWASLFLAALLAASALSRPTSAVSLHGTRGRERSTWPSSGGPELMGQRDGGNSYESASSDAAEDEDDAGTTMTCNSCAPADDGATAEGDSRSVGGETLDEVFPWITLLWRSVASGLRDPHPGDGFLAGLGVRIHRNFMIANKESITASGLGLDDVHKLELFKEANNNLPVLFQYSPPASIDLSKGKSTQDSGIRHQEIADLGHGMGLFHLNAIDTHFVVDELTDLLDNQRPQLQSDPSAKDNCYIYSYSVPRPLGTALNLKLGMQRTFSKWAVMLETGCEKSQSGSICGFTYDRYRPGNEARGEDEGGYICHTLSDVGAPIMCGNKLSYIVTRQNFLPNVNCVSSFNAWRLADYYDKLKNIHTTHKTFGK